MRILKLHGVVLKEQYLQAAREVCDESRIGDCKKRTVWWNNDLKAEISHKKVL